MEKKTIDLQLTEVLTVAVGHDPSFIALECSTEHLDMPQIVMTLPTAELPRLVARLTAAAARTATLEAQRAQTSEVAIAQQRHALVVTHVHAEVNTTTPNPSHIAVFAMTTGGAVIPLSIERPAAQALLAALAGLLAH